MLRRIHRVASAGSTAGEEERAPAPQGQHERGQHRRQQVADSPRRLHQSDGLAAMLRRPGFGHQHRPGGPLAAQADTHDGAPEDQFANAARVAVNAVNTEKARMDHIRARARPKRSQSQPKSIPPEGGGHQGRRCQRAGSRRS